MIPSLLHIRNNFRRTPSVFFCLFFFSLVILILNFFILHSDKDLQPLIIPFTGWGFGSDYTLIFIAFLAIISYKDRIDNPFTKLVKIFYILLISNFVIPFYFGLSDYINVEPQDYTNSNPYLRYTVYTPIYNVLLPLFWILTLSFSFFKYTRATSPVV